LGASGFFGSSTFFGDSLFLVSVAEYPAGKSDLRSTNAGIIKLLESRPKGLRYLSLLSALPLKGLLIIGFRMKGFPLYASCM
jgi:hypothetical protein